MNTPLYVSRRVRHTESVKDSFCRICDNYPRDYYCKRRLVKGKNLQYTAVSRGWCNLGIVGDEEMVSITLDYVEDRHRVRYSRVRKNDSLLRKAFITEEGLEDFEI